MLQSQRNQYSTTHHHNSTQHLVHIKSDQLVRFNSQLADQQADRKFDGSYNLKKSNLCTECNEFKSVNGSCSC